MVVVLVLAMPTGAAIRWCRVDPIVLLDGTQVAIMVSIPEEYQGLVSGPIGVTIRTPDDIERELVGTDAGFNGHGEQVTFDDGRSARRGAETFPVTVKVTVPIRTRGVVPTRVELIPTNGPPAVFVGTHRSTKIKSQIRGTDD